MNAYTFNVGGLFQNKEVVNQIVISWEPRVFLYEGLFSDQDIDDLMDVSGVESIKRQDVPKDLQEKIAQMSEIHYDHGEDLEILTIEPKTKFPYRKDALDLSNVYSKGNKMATIVIMLSTSKKGFLRTPNEDISITKGSAVLMFNMKTDGTVDEKSKYKFISDTQGSYDVLIQTIYQGSLK
eukprot:TRINITY_DN1120_c0_g1_i1.p1 TRINITY_DN1120_c0_g1~~TRINITY_DN1120_c0_g1_i1.p1  ORF type:complete len:181 (-),score=40.32 TRINITY_DN1120_c0_g1_i1:69-611(-)